MEFYMDGDTEFPALSDNATEDYFGGAWGFSKDPQNNRAEQESVSPFRGLPLAYYRGPQAPRKFSLYRRHLLDSVGFRTDLKVTIQAPGWFPSHRYQPLTDDIASMAYRYQLEPHQPFAQLPGMNDRWDR